MTGDTYERKERHEQNGSMMLELAEQVEDHYTRPSPAAEYRPLFFPDMLNQGIFGGILVGALLGILLAWLVHSGQVTPTGWEGLFSLVPFSFYSFFAFVGGAVGLAAGGILTLLAAPVPDLDGEEPQAVVVDEELDALVVAEEKA